MIYRDATASDYPAIVGLVNSVFGLSRTCEWFEHFHMQNPAGQSILLVAQNEAGEIVSFRSLVLSLARVGNERLLCAQLADASTRPDYRGNGIFGRITQAAFDRFFEMGGQLIYGYPGDMSHPIYTKRFGFAEPCAFSQCVYPYRIPAQRGWLSSAAVVPHRLVFGTRKVGQVSSWSVSEGIDTLKFRNQEGFEFSRDPAWLKWRLSIPGRSYRVIAVSQDDFAIVGSISRGQARVATIAELRSTSAKALSRLLASVARECSPEDFDGVYTWIQPKSTGRYMMSGYIPLPGRRTRLIVKYRDRAAEAHLSKYMVSPKMTLIDTDAY